jgi:16S rRNA (adenine1518-N6/adenine1519-N6)-dimethyltransferase
MKISEKKRIKKLIKEKKLFPLKKWGQNFLTSKIIIKRIVSEAHLKENDQILEIGPGLGILTEELIKKTKKVIAVEKDRRLVVFLREKFKTVNNLEIIEGDILKITNQLGFKNNYKVIANLPYSISLRVIRKFLQSKNPPSEMILMVQKEVAQRICAQKPKVNLASLMVQFYARAKILFFVSRKYFLPAPKVDGAVIKIFGIKKNSSKINEEIFFKIVRIGFAFPRKTLANNLVYGLKLNKQEVEKVLLENDINPSIRASFLDLEDWKKIAKLFSKYF